MSLPLSVLDLVGMRTGESAGTAIARTVDLAQHAEGWGYRRFWLAEVDSMDGIWNDFERAAVENKLRAAIVGSAETVQAGLERLVSVTGADEVIVVTDTWDHDARLDSYRRVAEVARRIGSDAAAGADTALSARSI